MLDALCQGISLYVVCMCTIAKIPQIRNIAQAWSSKGVSQKSLIMELWCFSSVIAYLSSNNFAISNYLEHIVLGVSDLVLLGLIFNIDRKIPLASITLLTAMIFYFAFLMTDHCPSWLLSATMASVAPVLASSKLTQIVAIIKTKCSGSVSIHTWLIMSSTAIGRLITSLVQGLDLILMITVGQAVVLNLGVVACIYYYNDQHKKKTKAE